MKFTQTRKEIELDYDVRDGTIRSLGKFEGEPIFAPYFAELSGEGEMIGVDDEDNSELHMVDDDERETFPEISADTVAIATCEDSQGFFYCRELNARELADLRRKLAEEVQS